MNRKTLLKIKSSLLLMFCLLSTAAFAQSTMIPIGGTGTGTSQYWPIRAYYGYNYSQTIYVADSLLANGASGAGFIDKIRYQPATTASWANVTAWTIYMGNTTNTGFASATSWIPVSSLTQVFSGTAPSTVTSGTWVEFTLSSPFFWDGTSNLVIAVDENTPGYTTSGEFYFSSFTSTPATGTRALLYYSDVTNPDPLTPPSANNTGSAIAKIQLEWSVATACSGIPNIPVASGPANICPNAPLALSSTGFTMGTGISYQWQSFNTGTSTWDPVANATATNVTIPTGQATATDYRLVTTCVNGGGTSTSNTVSVAMNSFVNCYCTSGATNAFDGEITNVTVGPLNNSSTCAASNQLYTDFTATVPAATLMQASVYPVSVMAGSCGGSYSAYVKIFIDFDHDGMFTGVGEEVYAGVPPGGNYTPAGVAATGTLSIPATALTGNTRMRVILNQTTTASAVTPCGTYNYGETEDYLVNIVVAQNCSGTPGAVTASGPATVCANNSITLTSSGYSSGLGISYAWQQFNTATSTWDPIAGATNPFVTISGGQTAATDYRMVTTCANGGGQDFSNTVTVGMSPFAACYCSPLNGTTLHTSTSNYITNVAIPTTTLNHATPTLGTGGYTYADPTTPSNTASLTQGVPYTINATHSSTSTSINTEVWFDWDQSGTFDASEYYVLTGSAGSSTTTVTPPTTALPGNTGMRIRAVFSTTITFGAAGACANISQGRETQDYIITVVQAIPCSGFPSAVTASGPPSACSGSSFTLNAAGFSTGLGISYEWQSYNTTTSSWDPIAGSNTPFYTVTAGQTVATDYRFVTTCSNGGGQDFSNTVTVGMSSFYLCYCSPMTGTTLHSTAINYITNVTITGTTLNNSSTTVGAGGYTQYFPSTTSTTASLDQGIQYSISVTHPYTGYYGGAWIDWDQNGTMDAAEFISMTTTGTVSTGTFIIPYASTAGTTGLRVRMNYNPLTSGDPCTNIGYETEDYIVNIIQAVGCSGIPNAAVVSGPANACVATPFTLTATGYSTGTGISYQWEFFNTATSTWDPMPGTNTNPTYSVANQTAATDYRFTTVCSNGGGNSVSNTLSVGQNPPTQCYCTPTYLYNCSSGDDIDDVILTGDVAPGINNLNTPCPPTGYMDYTTMSATVSPGLTYSGNVTTNYGSASEDVRIWVDYNLNGVFEATESVATISSISNASTGAFSFTIPAATAIGSYRMRVRLVYNTTASTIDPCINYNFGEAHDYMLNVSAPPTCLPPTSPSVTAGTATTGGASWTPSASTPANGYEWRVFLQGSGPNGTPVASGLTTTAVTSASISGLSAASMYTFYVRAHCSAIDSSNWVSSNFTTPCATVTGQFTQTFNTNATPLCWTNTGPEFWLFSNGAGPGYGVTGSTDHTGNSGYFAWVDGSGTGTSQDITLTSPPVDITGVVSPTLRYWVKSYNIDDAANNKLIVEVLDGVNWVQVDSIQMNFPTSAWQQRNIPLIGITATTVQVRFVVDESNVGGSAFYNDILLDDISIISPLAITLGEISAVNAGSRNRVDWNTLGEEAGDYFELERSANGRDFTRLGHINSQGRAATYSYWDESPVSGLNYYRLKMMDATGSFQYSKVVTAKVKGEGSFTVEAYPNPVGDVLTVTVYGTAGTNPTVSISDVTGKVVKIVSVVNNGATIDMGGLAQGMYLVKYTDTNHTQTIKVNKK